MSIIRKPSEIEVKSTVSILIYGQPGVGKSTLALSAPDCVLLDYDGGVQRINSAHRRPTVQVRRWEDTQTALDEIENELPETKTIIVDTVGKMLDYMSEYIMRTNPRMRKADGSLSLQGYGVRKNMFVDFIRKTAIMGRNVIFVAHEKEEKRGEEVVKRPEIGGSSANDLIKELDLVGYMSMFGKDRTIAFNPTEAFYAKNTCSLPPLVKLPPVVDEDGDAVGDNNFIRRLLATYRKSQERNQEMSARYDTLMASIATAVDAAKGGAELNAILDSIAKETVFNSALLGRKMVDRRAAALGLVADKITGRYAE